jgi:hypothetical protein
MFGCIFGTRRVGSSLFVSVLSGYACVFDGFEIYNKLIRDVHWLVSDMEVACQFVSQLYPFRLEHLVY